MKCLVLFSGGLDSALAARIMTEVGVEPVLLHFTGPFSCGEHTLERVAALAESLGMELIVHRLGPDFLELVSSPQFGYGSGLNPCIDCRIHELKIARRYMDEIGASFLVTGEVVGQRPMSQREPVLQLIDREAEVTGLVLRPLSAQILPPTIPEQRGWVDRSRLLSIRGRSRKAQLQLADQFGIDGYATPAGGCLLTMRDFVRRLEDLLDSGGRLTERDIALLRLGRVFRLTPSARVVVGRNRVENEQLAELAASNDYVLQPTVPGPTAVVTGKPTPETLRLAASIVARYSDAEDEVPVTVSGPEGKATLTVSGLADSELDILRV